MSEYSEYDVRYLSSSGIRGKLLLFPDKVVFEPKEDNSEEIEIPISKIKDVRFATEKDISALDVFLWGPVIGVLAKRKHKMLTIDCEDEFGIIQHLTFEGYDVEAAVEELYDIRKMKKMGSTATAKLFLKKKLKDGNWQCSRCLRINSPNAKFCTKCGETRRRHPSS